MARDFPLQPHGDAGRIGAMLIRNSLILGLIPGLILGLMLLSSGPARAQAADEVVSFRCALAIDAVLARLDEDADNKVIREALSDIDDVNGQLVCIAIDAEEIQVRLQSTDMHPNDNRLVFSLDARTYVVNKTFYGR